MRLLLTKGIAGDVTKILGESDDINEIWKMISDFKDDKKNKDEFKIESYSRYLFFTRPEDDPNGVAIDFGDYSYFLFIEGATSEMFKSSLK